ncbi:MAG: phytanoyl-CoA dioxygenase family protein, partial [Pseudomonadota bacterium]
LPQSIEKAYGEAFLVNRLKSHQAAFDTNTRDGTARFDLTEEHTSTHPMLRRVNNPVEISQDYMQAMRDSMVADYVADLIGPNIKFHHSKLNCKQPGSQTEVKWHQDFCYTPHSNDDLITTLLMLDDIVEENGALEVLPGSHQGCIESLWQDGVFTGAISDQKAKEIRKNSHLCVGSAGSVCLMHTRLLHGSAPNLSSKSRNLFICVYSAEDAYPLCPSPVSAVDEGMIIRGKKTNNIRSNAFKMTKPEKGEGASFFDLQQKAVQKRSLM